MFQNYYIKFKMNHFVLLNIIKSKNSSLTNLDDNMIINTQTIKILQDLVSNQEYCCQKISLNNSQKTYMMKTVNLPSKLSQPQLEKILQQIKIITSLSIPSLVKYQGGFIDSKNRLSIVFQEFQHFIPIQERIHQIRNKNCRPFNEEEVLQIGKRLFQILQKLHKKSIIHGNININSVLIDDNNIIKLGQVNPTKNFEKELMCSLYNNVKYMAFQIKKNGLFLEASSDIWSIGCILYQLATSQPYYEENNQQGMIQQNFYDKKATLIPDSYSSFFKDVLKKCLLLQSSKRPTVEQILQAQFFQEQPIKIYSASKICHKMSSLKKIGRIGTVNNTCANEKKKAVHFQQVIHRISIMNGKSLVELLDEEKKDLDSDQEHVPNKSRFCKQNDNSFNSDEEEQTEYKVKVSAPTKKRSSQNLTQSIQMKQIMQAKLLKNTVSVVKEKKFMSNSFMSYLDSYKKQKVELFKKADSLLENRIQQDEKEVQQHRQHVVLKQSLNQKFCQNRKIIKQQLKGPLSFKTKQNKNFSASAGGFVGWKKQNKQPQISTEIPGRKL